MTPQWSKFGQWKFLLLSCCSFPTSMLDSPYFLAKDIPESLYTVITWYLSGLELIKPCTYYIFDKKKHVSTLSACSGLITLAKTCMCCDAAQQEKMLHHFSLAQCCQSWHSSRYRLCCLWHLSPRPWLPFVGSAVQKLKFGHWNITTLWGSFFEWTETFLIKGFIWRWPKYTYIGSAHSRQCIVVWLVSLLFFKWENKVQSLPFILKLRSNSWPAFINNREWGKRDDDTATMRKKMPDAIRKSVLPHSGDKDGAEPGWRCSHLNTIYHLLLHMAFLNIPNKLWGSF